MVVCYDHMHGILHMNVEEYAVKGRGWEKVPLSLGGIEPKYNHTPFSGTKYQAMRFGADIINDISGYTYFKS